MRRIVAWLLLLAGAPPPLQARELRVCADPNNMPFSNSREEGFENRIARLVAAELGANLRYTWWAQRRGNVRETLNAGKCDLIAGVASGVEMLATTRPYYRSTYVVVARQGALSDVSSFDDPRLRSLRIGVQLIGDDGANIPPAHALSARGIVANVRGYTVYGDYDQPNTQSGIIDAVARGDVDIAYVWGPTAGWFAQRSPVKLSVTPVSTADARPDLPMTFAIAMGLRKGDTALKAEVEQALNHRAGDIRRILTECGVPLIP